MHLALACCEGYELSVGGHAAKPDCADSTVELNDWYMIIRRWRTLSAARSHPPTAFAVGRLLSGRIPTIARVAKHVFG